MIFEYAVEPELVVTWRDRKEGRYFIEKFGVSEGRLVSRFPKGWVKLVWEAFEGSATFAESRDIERLRLQEVLVRLTERMIHRQGYDGNRTLWWLQAAEREHSRCEFHLILAREKPRAHEAVAVASEIDSEPRWAAPNSRVVPRSAEEIAGVLARMLRCSSEIIFVDPHFDPNKDRYRRTLQALLQATFKFRPGPPPKRIEIHVADRKSRNEIERESKAKLPAVIPLGRSVRILCLKERPGGQELHNRYILTDIGGVAFGHGLDESDSNAVGPSDDIHRLEAEVYRRRWDQYRSMSRSPSEPDSNSTAFERDGEPIIVDGADRSFKLDRRSAHS